MLHLVSLAHRVLCAAVLHPELQTRKVTPQLRGRVETCCQWHLNSRWRQWQAVRRDTAPRTWMWSQSSTAALAPRELQPPTPSPQWGEPYRASPPIPCPKHVCSRARAPTPPFSDQRIKLSFVSEPNSVSIYWHGQHQRRGPLLGPNSKGLVT